MKKIKAKKEIKPTVKIVKKYKEVKSELKGDIEIDIKPNPKFSQDPILPETGTRFALNSARQQVLELVCKHIKEGKTIGEIREEFCFYNKENGYRYNLDSGYVFFVISCHSEYFKLFKNGVLRQIKKFEINLEEYRKSKKYIEQIKKNVCLTRKTKRKDAVTI